MRKRTKKPRMKFREASGLGDRDLGKLIRAEKAVRRKRDSCSSRNVRLEEKVAMKSHASRMVLPMKRDGAEVGQASRCIAFLLGMNQKSSVHPYHVFSPEPHRACV